MRKKPEVGQKLFCVNDRRQYFCEVTKVGRKYFYINQIFSGGKISNRPEKVVLETWKVLHEVGSAPVLYEKKEDFDKKVELSRYKNFFREQFTGFHSPKNFNLETAKKAMEVFGWDLKDEVD